MKHFLLNVLAIFAISSTMNAQNLSLGLRLGAGMYFMNSLNDLQEVRIEQSNLPLLTTERFPVSPLYRVEIARNSEGFISKIGFFYTFNSTGTRSTLSDYSGKYYLDAIINGHQVGMVFEHLLKLKDSKGYGVYTDIAYLRTKLKTRDFISLVFPSSYTNSEENQFLASGLTLEPGIYGSYRWKGFNFKLNLGLLLCFSEGLFLANEKDMKLFVNGEKVKPGWTGFRIGLQVDLGKQKSKNS